MLTKTCRDNAAYYAAYGHRLRVTRIALGLTEQEAAEAHGATLKTYRKWENGARQRGGDSFIKFADAYNISLNWLLGGDGSTLDRHLTVGGKVAILPVLSAEQRRRARAANVATPPTAA